MKVGSGRAVPIPLWEFVLTRLVSLFVMLGVWLLGGRFELRLANGGPPPGPLWVLLPLPSPFGGRGVGGFLALVAAVICVLA